VTTDTANGRMEGKTNGQPENILLRPANLVGQMHKNETNA